MPNFRSTAGSAPLTRRSGRGLGGTVAPLVVAGVAVVMVVLAVARLDPVYDKVPGVFRSWQLMPLPLEVRYELADVRRDFGDKTPAEETQEQNATKREAEDVDALRTRLNHLSDDVSVRSWQEGSGGVVVVGVAEVDDRTQAASRLSGSAFGKEASVRTLAVGERFVVVVTVSYPHRPARRTELADRTADQVEASVGMARVLWWEVISLGPFLLFPVLFGIAYLAWIFVWLAFNVLKLFVYLVVVVPLSLLGLRKRPAPQRPLVSEPDPLGDLAPGVERVDLDSFGQPFSPSAAAWFTALVLALAVAIPALTRSLWTSSLVWGAVGIAFALVWLGRGQKDPWARAARWTVAAAVVFDLAEALFGLGPGLPTDSPLALVVALLLVAGAVVLAWRHAAGRGSSPGYVTWYADVDLRSGLYLVGLTGVAVAGGALFLGTNGDLDLGSQLASKGLALAGLATVPLVGRRARAARDAARRDWARDRGVPEVLLLRSFVDDGLRVPSRRKSRRGFEQFIPTRHELFEDVVVRAFTQLGPVVAIARPGTGQTELGASRDLIVGEDWLTAVKAEMAEAAYIVVILGKGHGLSLELETLQELKLLDHVCLVVPPVEPDDAAERLDRGTSEVAGEEGWGRIASGEARDAFDRRHHVAALLGAGDRRFVAISLERDSTAYLRLGAFLAGRASAAARVKRSASDRDEGSEA